MRRRKFLGVMAGAAAWPLASHGQQNPRRVSVLLGAYTETDEPGRARIETFLKTLRELGWEDGRNLRIDYRWGGGSAERNRRFAAEAVQSAPDAIVVTSDPVLAQLHGLTSTIPVIFTQVSEPVEGGIVGRLPPSGGRRYGEGPDRIGALSLWILWVVGLRQRGGARVSRAPSRSCPAHPQSA